LLKVIQYEVSNRTLIWKLRGLRELQEQMWQLNVICFVIVSVNNRSNISLGHCVTFSVSNRSNISLGHCVTFSVSNRSNISLGHCVTFSVSNRSNISLGHCVTFSVANQTCALLCATRVQSAATTADIS